MISIGQNNNTPKTVKDIYIGQNNGASKRVYEVVADNKLKYWYGGPYKVNTFNTNIPHFLQLQPYHDSNWDISYYQPEYSAAISGSTKGLFFYIYNDGDGFSSDCADFTLYSEAPPYDIGTSKPKVFQLNNTSPDLVSTRLEIQVYDSALTEAEGFRWFSTTAMQVSPKTIMTWLYPYENQLEIDVLYVDQNQVNITDSNIMKYHFNVNNAEDWLNSIKGIEMENRHYFNKRKLVQVTPKSSFIN